MVAAPTYLLARFLGNGFKMLPATSAFILPTMVASHTGANTTPPTAPIATLPDGGPIKIIEIICSFSIAQLICRCEIAVVHCGTTDVTSGEMMLYMLLPGHCT